jgi:hypothetical protein
MGSPSDRRRPDPPTSGGDKGNTPLNPFSRDIRRDAPSNPFISAIAEVDNDDPKSVNKIGAYLLGLQKEYHETVLDQSQRSFNVSLVFASIGLIFFIVAVIIALIRDLNSLAAIVPLLSGAVVEVVAGIGFYLYRKTTAQLSSFHGGVDVMQRYILANSLCTSLDDDERNKTRVALIHEISQSQVTAVHNS